MFTAVGLFKDVACPEQPPCLLPKCIFAHEPNSPTQKSGKRPNGSLDAESESISAQPRKRPRVGSASQLCHSHNGGAGVITTPKLSSSLPTTESRSISPPPLRSQKPVGDGVQPPPAITTVKTSRTTNLSQTATILLNPRLLPNPPASHSVRLQLVRILHDHLSRLNNEVLASNDPEKATLELSKNEIVSQALDEEAKAVKDNPSVYANVVKLRILKLKKMKFLEWKEERWKQIVKLAAQRNSVKLANPQKAIETGLDMKQEMTFLSQLLTKQKGLDQHGYVIKKPTESEVDQARTGLEAAQGWEQCDRCRTRFQVFPGRHEDGALTSGGTCNYHPARPRRPMALNKADKGLKESIYACCNENVGVSAGCTTALSHVFKVSNPARLQIVTPFKETPSNPPVAEKRSAICFDCEMGYTTCGLELIRLTATHWPTGEEAIDILVRPVGEVLDLNSRFSGVWPKDFADARPYRATTVSEAQASRKDASEGRVLQVVESPKAARDLLFSFLDPSTPLIGHALENDLNAARIIHPSIVDTALLYPHPRGLPIRFGLKMLMKKHLDQDIQTGDGSAGHDSKEDARAAGELVRNKMQDRWRLLKMDGWTFEGDTLIPPMTRADVMRAEISKIKK